MRMWALNPPESRRVGFAPVHPIPSGCQPLCCLAQASPGSQEQGCGSENSVCSTTPAWDLRAASSALRLGPSGDVITTSANGFFLLDVLVSLICSCFKSNHESNSILREWFQGFVCAYVLLTAQQEMITERGGWKKRASAPCPGPASAKKPVCLSPRSSPPFVPWEGRLVPQADAS